jgi:hypothetical protein
MVSATGAIVWSRPRGVCGTKPTESSETAASLTNSRLMRSNMRWRLCPRKHSFFCLAAVIVKRTFLRRRRGNYSNPPLRAGGAFRRSAITSTTTLHSIIKIPDATLMALAGHMSREMLEHYSHVRMAAKREALDKLAGGLIFKDTKLKGKPQRASVQLRLRHNERHKELVFLPALCGCD